MPTIIRTPSADGLLIGTWSITPVFSEVNDYPDTTTESTMGTASSSAGFEYVTTGNLVPTGSTINEIRLRYVIRKTGGGSSNIGAAIWNESNAVAFTDNHNPSTTTTTTRTGTWTTNPWTTSAWTVDEVNRVGSNRINLFGVRSTDSNPTIEFYSTQLEIDYTLAVAAGRSFGFIIG
jgi:hypothetical protein